MHDSASAPSPDALSILLETEGTDVDLQNRLDRATPLHLAVKLENEDARQGVIEMLLDAGADPRCVSSATKLEFSFTMADLRLLNIDCRCYSLRDRHGLRVQDYLRPTSSDVDKEIAQMLRVAMAEKTMGGVANNADLADDDDGEPGSGSDSD